MSKYIHNVSGSTKSYVGTEIANNSFYLIPKEKEITYSQRDALLTDIANGDVFMSKDGSTDITDGISIQLDFLKGNLPAQVDAVTSPFAAKTLSDGSKLYTRIHGITQTLTVSTQNVDFSVPYVNCKIDKIEIIGADVGDKVNFKILDTPTGTITTIPNYQLNQFGFDVYLAKDDFKYESRYDADLIQNMTLRMEYTSTTAKDIYINVILHEVV